MTEIQERLEERAASIRWPLSEIELLILAHFDGANNDEIARRIHRPVGTVRSTTSRGHGAPQSEISHVLKVFLLDPAGVVREIYDSTFLHPRTVLNDVETLLRER